MKHIIDSEAVEKRKLFEQFAKEHSMSILKVGEAYSNDDTNYAWWIWQWMWQKALATSPQVDANTPPDVYDIVVDTGDGIYHTAEVVHFQQSGSKRMIQVRLGEPQADDVLKDAEKWRAHERELQIEFMNALELKKQ